jgi:hypothetical protein
MIYVSGADLLPEVIDDGSAQHGMPLKMEEIEWNLQG